MYCVLVFGLSCSPYYFQKVLRPVVCYMRPNNRRVSLWVDDWLLMARHSLMADHRDLLVDTLQDLGSCFINFPKSDLEPSTEKVYVGFEINSSGLGNVPCIKVIKNKLQKLKKTIAICRALKRKHIQARALARIAGMCVAMMRAILPAKLKLRNVTKCSWYDVLFIEVAAEKDLQ